jgi:hypothetical protein
MKACAVCGASIWQRLRQWHNRDIGYSICADCVGWLRRRKDYDPKDFEFLYGREGQHYPRVIPACSNCGLSRQDTMIAARALNMVENPVCCYAHLDEDSVDRAERALNVQ